MRYVINEDTVEAAKLTPQYRTVISKIRNYTERHGTQSLDVLLLCASVPSNKHLIRKIIHDLTKRRILTPELYKEN